MPALLTTLFVLIGAALGIAGVLLIAGWDPWGDVDVAAIAERARNGDPEPDDAHVPEPEKVDAP